jgi:hypothetical protein
MGSDACVIKLQRGVGQAVSPARLILLTGARQRCRPGTQRPTALDGKRRRVGNLGGRREGHTDRAPGEGRQRTPAVRAGGERKLRGIRAGHRHAGKRQRGGAPIVERKCLGRAGVHRLVPKKQLGVVGSGSRVDYRGGQYDIGSRQQVLR